MSAFSVGVGIGGMTKSTKSIGYDPYYSSVKLLLHGGGTNGSVTITDSSSLALSPATVAGNAQISTAQQRAGTGCMTFDGTGDYIQYAANAAFVAGTGDFTYEFWCRPTDTTVAVRGLISQGYPTGGNFGVLIRQNGTDIQYFAGASVFTATAVLVLNTWTWVQLIRSNGTSTLYINGVSATSAADSYNFTLTNAITVGSSTTTLAETFFGQITDLRITVGVARAASRPGYQLIP
jgi:hypothetical protein